MTHGHRSTPASARWNTFDNTIALAGMGVEDVAVFSMEWLPPPSFMQSRMSWYDDYCFPSSAPTSSYSSAPISSYSSGSSGSAFGGISAPVIGMIAIVIFLAARANRKSKAEEPGQEPGPGTGQQTVSRRIRPFSLARLASRQSMAEVAEGQRRVPAQALGGATAARPPDAVLPGVLLPPGGDPKRRFWV